MNTLLKKCFNLLVCVTASMVCYCVFAQPSKTSQHIVFMDAWSHYEGKNSIFINWLETKGTGVQYLQQDFNITPKQLREFKSHYPQFANLTLDKNMVAMSKYGVWQTPFHIIKQNNEVIFKGNDALLLGYLKNTGQISQTEFEQFKQTLEPKKSKATFAKQPPAAFLKQGDRFIDFTEKSTSGSSISLKQSLAELNKNQTLKLVFIDSLCPMPHFPDCENQLARLARLQNQPQVKYIAVVNGYYVNSEHVLAFLTKHKLTLPAIWDEDNSIFKAYGVSATPLTFTLNKNGDITRRSTL